MVEMVARLSSSSLTTVPRSAASRRFYYSPSSIALVRSIRTLSPRATAPPSSDISSHLAYLPLLRQTYHTTSVQKRFVSRQVFPILPPSTSPRHRSHATMTSATSFYEFQPKDKKGSPYPLAELKGKVVLVVNTASKCGFTPQFEGLEKLYKDLKPAHPDFEIIGFPCNQFGSQDPGSDDEIQSFCQLNYGVSFPVLGKTDVNGDKAEPVWEWMKKSKPGIMGLQRIKWNFEKFLIGKDGKVVQRWASTSKPESLKSVIETELKK